MRLKTYTAPTMSQAMGLVRAELGDDAIIVSTQKGAGGKGFRITAALEMADTEEAITRMLADDDQPALIEPIRETLEFHGTPGRLVERLLNAARTITGKDSVMAFAGALDAGFGFQPLPEKGSLRPIMLAGPPGAGKTVTVAKLAARAAMARRSAKVITTDVVRAGAVDQLAAFTRILKIELVAAKNASAVARAVADREPNSLCFIDSAGINPFSEADLANLSELAIAANCEPVLVVAAGGDPMEAGDIGEIFAGIGATRLLATRLDMTRRLGSILAAADAGRLKFCDATSSPNIASGLTALNSVSLAQLLMPRGRDSDTKPSFSEAM